MRADARSLLDRLGRSDFAYKEFADRFSDLELWPLFEALLKDPRVFEQDGTVANPAEPVSTPGIAAALLGERAGSAGRTPGAPSAGAETLADLFSRYENKTVGAPQDRQGEDVRAMLRRLSELDARGEL